MPELSTYSNTSTTAKELARLSHAGAIIQPGMNSVVGDGATDDRVAIQAILDAHAGQPIRFVEGTYLISNDTGDGNGGIRPASNTTLILDPSATLKAKVEAYTDNGIIHLVDVSNVNISGGIIDGQRASNTTGAMNGIYLMDSHHCHISHMEIKNIPGTTADGGSSGDGILFRGGSNPGSTYNSATHCYIHDCVRQGISISRGKGNYIAGNRIYNILGTDPGGCIDLEADTVGATCIDNVIHGNFMEAANYGIVVNQSFGATLTDNVIEDSYFQNLRIVDSQQIKVMGNSFTQSTNFGGHFSGSNLLNRAYYITMMGNQFIGAAGGKPLLMASESNKITIIGNFFQQADESAIRIASGTSLGADNHGGYIINENIFRSNSSGGTVIDIANDVEGWTTTDVTIKNNHFSSGGVTATNAIGLTLITGAEILTWDIGPNHINDITNHYAGYPTGFGPGRLVPTASLPAYSAALEGQIFIERTGSGALGLAVYGDGVLKKVALA